MQQAHENLGLKQTNKQKSLGLKTNLTCFEVTQGKANKVVNLLFPCHHNKIIEMSF